MKSRIDVSGCFQSSRIFFISAILIVVWIASPKGIAIAQQPPPDNSGEIAKVIRSSFDQSRDVKVDGETKTASVKKDGWWVTTTTHPANSKELIFISDYGVNGSLMLGGIYRGSELHKFKYSEFDVPRNKVTISLNQEGNIAVENADPVVVNNPELSSMKEAINILAQQTFVPTMKGVYSRFPENSYMPDRDEFLKWAGGRGRGGGGGRGGRGKAPSAGPDNSSSVPQKVVDPLADFQWSFIDASSKNSLEAQLGMSYKSLTGKLDLDASFSNSGETRTVLARCEQVYFRVSANKITPENAVAPGTDVQRVKREFTPGSFPVYLSEVSYGRVILASFETKLTNAELKGSLSAASSSILGGEGKVNTSAVSKEKAASTKMNIYVYGGSTNDYKEEVIGLDNIVKVFAKQLGFRNILDNKHPTGGGFPIKYQFRSLKDNTLAKIVYPNEYSITERMPAELKINVALVRILCSKAKDEISADEIEISDLSVSVKLQRKSSQGNWETIGGDQALIDYDVPGKNSKDLDEGDEWIPDSTPQDFTVDLLIDDGKRFEMSEYRLEFTGKGAEWDNIGSTDHSEKCFKFFELKDLVGTNEQEVTIRVGDDEDWMLDVVFKVSRE